VLCALDFYNRVAISTLWPNIPEDTRLLARLCHMLQQSWRCRKNMLHSVCLSITLYVNMAWTRGSAAAHSINGCSSSHHTVNTRMPTRSNTHSDHCSRCIRPHSSIGRRWLAALAVEMEAREMETAPSLHRKKAQCRSSPRHPLRKQHILIVTHCTSLCHQSRNCKCCRTCNTLCYLASVRVLESAQAVEAVRVLESAQALEAMLGAPELEEEGWSCLLVSGSRVSGPERPSPL